MTEEEAPDALEATMLALVTKLGAGKTLDPTEVARAIAGDHPEQWGPLMQAVRQAAIRLMKQGKVVILRKGRPVDPDDFKGIYRITGPQAAAAPTQDLI